jgi:hypothetical protein
VDRERDDLMKRLLAIHVELRNLERKALPPADVLDARA